MYRPDGFVFWRRRWRATLGSRQTAHPEDARGATRHFAEIRLPADAAWVTLALTYRTEIASY